MTDGVSFAFKTYFSANPITIPIFQFLHYLYFWSKNLISHASYAKDLLQHFLNYF